MKHPYSTLNEMLKATYGQKIRKICVDGGFSCPNRDGTCGVGGCIFCGERGSGEHIDPSQSIREQVASVLQKAKPDSQWIVYFQNFTNTYAPVDVLRVRYDAALIDERIRILDIGTRPDCVDDTVCELLQSYQESYEVWVELGLQTANDETARRIHRGYDLVCFREAVKRLQAHGLPVIVHIIIGLPGETIEDIRHTISVLNELHIDGIKIHSLFVMKDTELARQYEQGLFTPISMQTYIDRTMEAVLRLSPEIVIHRLTGNCLREHLLAPDWIIERDLILYTIDRRMIENGWHQGLWYEADCSM